MKHLERSLRTIGAHAEDGALHAPKPGAISIPLDMPAALLNPITVRAFNTLYFGKAGSVASTRRVPVRPFFYPLDALAHWRRLYGKAGFVQSQFVLPKAAGTPGLHQILQRIAASGRGSFLAVLKAFGPGNDSPLSFPLEGWTLALDFKAEPAVLALLDGRPRGAGAWRPALPDKGCTHERGNIQSRLPKRALEAVRARYHAFGKFASMQTRRLGLQ